MGRGLGLASGGIQIHQHPTAPCNLGDMQLEAGGAEREGDSEVLWWVVGRGACLLVEKRCEVGGEKREVRAEND